MPFSPNASVDSANAIRAKYIYAQLNTGAAGFTGSANPSSANRVEVTWTQPNTSGNFGLAESVLFTGGEPDGPIYSVTMWDASVDGTYGGEFKLPDGVTFDSSGQYIVDTLSRVPKFVSATGRKP